MNIVTASDIKNSFGKYLDIALIDGEVLIKRHNKIVAKIVPVDISKQNQNLENIANEDQ